MYEFIKEYYSYIIVFGFCFIEVITCAIVMWELKTGKSIVDKLWEVGSWLKSRMKK